MVNYACVFSQSGWGEYFEWIINAIKPSREATEMEIYFQTIDSIDGSFHLLDPALLYFSKHNSFMMHSS